MTRITIRGRRWPSVVLLAIAAIAIGSIFGAARSGHAARAVAPTNTAPPTISGTLQVGSTLTATNGQWTGTAPLAFAHTWSRCDENGASCSTISGANNNTYQLKQADAGTTLRATVRATNNDGNASATSVPTGVIRSQETPPATGCPSGTGGIQVSDLSPPARLSIDQQTTTPGQITGGTNQLIAHVRITACNGRPVQGALVFISVVPYDQFAGDEVSTAADGTVNIPMSRLKGYPVSPRQQLLVMFIRARKPGEDPLGGISTRRLVSFPVTL
jgi:hypothetical protein